MTFLPEILIGTAILIALAVYAYYSNPRSKAEKIKLLKAYRRAQNLSMKLQDIVSKHILVHDAYTDEVFPGITFGDYLKELQYRHAVQLSETVYLKLRNGRSIKLKKKTHKLLEDEMVRLCEVKKLLAPIENMKKLA
jgi:argininosuccinate synthase